jgi:hypothetical protein
VGLVAFVGISELSMDLGGELFLHGSQVSVMLDAFALSCKVGKVLRAISSSIHVEMSFVVLVVAAVD